MHTAPTVIVLATAHPNRAATAPAEGASAWLFHSLLAQLARAADSGLPVALVAPSATLEAVRQAMPHSRITHSPLDNPMPGFGLAEALRAGVQTCATSQGWIMLPAHLPMLQPTTLREMGTLLRMHPVVYASHKNQPGMMTKINETFAKHNINISGQYLQTVQDIGYVVIDIDSDDVEQALRGMARPPVADLDALAARLGSAVQREALEALRRARWAGGSGPVARAALRAAFANGPEWRGQAREPAAPLPPPAAPTAAPGRGAPTRGSATAHRRRSPAMPGR